MIIKEELNNSDEISTSPSSECSEEEEIDTTFPPFPTTPDYGPLPSPPRPFLRVSPTTIGGEIMLIWNFGDNSVPTEVTSFELFVCEENPDEDKQDSWSESTWKKVGEMKALPLPMACTLSQFVEGHTYHFVVRAIDVFDRIGEFSYPGSITPTL